MKNLANAPPHLQRMLLQLQRFDVTIKYKPGPQMQLVDALSHCPARASPEIKLNMRVDYVAFSRSWIETIKEQLAEDPILATVYQLTQQGWPNERRHVPRVARRYFDFRDELSTDEDCFLKDRVWLFQILSRRSTCTIYMKGISLLRRQSRMPRNTFTGLVWMQTFQTTTRDARNASRGPRCPKSHYSHMTSQQDLG